MPFRKKNFGAFLARKRWRAKERERQFLGAPKKTTIFAQCDMGGVLV
jgi:hypothetical protein